MPNALFDILAGRYSDGRPVGGVPLAERGLQSIRDHLERLCGSRRGSLAHEPRYGLPDLGAVFRDLPGSLQPFAAAVQETIALFEPRLRQVQVRPAAETKGPSLQLEVAARAKERPVRFRIDFRGGGLPKVTLLETEIDRA